MFRRKHEAIRKELKWVTSLFTVDALVGPDSPRHRNMVTFIR
jgi:hypothetical protein